MENGRKRYINEVTALFQAFSITIPHEQVMDVKDNVAFFQAVKVRLTKFDITGIGKSDEEPVTIIPFKSIKIGVKTLDFAALNRNLRDPTYAAYIVSIILE